MDSLQWTSARIRRSILETAVQAGKGHLGGALSCTDILVSLYHGGILHLDPTRLDSPERDRFLLSKGHSCLALYAVLADMGFFKPEELTTFCQDNTRLAGHPDRMIPGIEMDSGSLGQGPGIAAGIALAARLTGRNYRTVVLVGDGECQEGSVWEAANFAGHHRLSNLALIVDRNGQCVLNFTRDCLNLDPLEAKFEACGWRVVTASGHDHGSILKAFEGWKASDHTAPLAVIADTIKGKGISFMEGQLRWHHGVPKGEELELARRELSERDETVVDS